MGLPSSRFDFDSRLRWGGVVVESGFRWRLTQERETREALFRLLVASIIAVVLVLLASSDARASWL